MADPKEEVAAAKQSLRVVRFSELRVHRNRSDNGSFSPVRKLSPQRKSLGALRSIKRRQNSERGSSVGKNNAVGANSTLAPRHKYSSAYADDEGPIPDMIITEPPAIELKDVWGLFIEESYRRKHNHPLIRQVRRQPIFQIMTVLVLENHGIEKIFEHLRPCKNLVALFLKGNRVITRDLVEIQHLEKLRHIDLSNNGIHFLPDPEKLSKVANLEYLQLHDNLLVGWRQLENLTCLTRLRHMTLQGNPSAKILGYRQFLIDNLPQLRSLDDYIVMDFERKDIKTMFPPENIKKDKLLALWRFRPFNKATTSWWPRLIELPESKPFLEKDRDLQTTIREEGFSMSCELDFVEKHLEELSYELRRKFEFCSPILTVQKTAKMFIYRKKYLKKRRMAKLLMWSLNRWNLRGHLHHFRKHMGLTASLLNLIGKVRLIQRLFREQKRRKELLLVLARRGQTIYHMKKVQNRTLQAALGLKSSNLNCEQRTLLFKKAQIKMLQNVGLIKQALSIQESNRFVLRKGIKTHTVEIRRSILMNLIISSFRCVRVIRAQSLFTLAIQSAIDNKKREADKKRKIVTLAPNTQMDDVMMPDMILQRDLQQQDVEDKIIEPRLQGATKSSRKSPSKPRREQMKRMNTFIKPSLEPHVAHHVSKNTRESISKVLSNPIIDENTALMEVTFSGDIEVALVIQTIASFNRRHDNVVQIFYEPFLRRFEATMILQRWFKGILFRRRLKPLFIERGNKFLLKMSLIDRVVTVENTIYSHYVLIQRVSRMIQRNFRKWRLRVRINCLANIAQYVSRIESNEVYLEQTAYRNLEAIFKSATGAPYNPHKEITNKDGDGVDGGKYSFNEKSPKKQSKKLKSSIPKKQAAEPIPHIVKTQTLSERRFQFEVGVKTHKVGISYGAKVDRAGRYLTSNLPLWFQRKTNTEIRKLQRVAKRQAQSPFANNIMSLIHMQPNAVNEGAPTVVKVRDIKLAIVERAMSNTKVVKICYSTIEEAKNRAITLALLTCNVRKSASSFVRLYMASDFQRRRVSEQCYREIRQVWKDNEIVDDDIRTYLVPDYTLQAQPHCGLLRKREEPYMTLLRARPKDKKGKSKYERFIVLGDADPKHIEETLGSAMIYNEVVGQMQPPMPIPDAELYASTDVEVDFPYKGRLSQAVVQPKPGQGNGQQQLKLGGKNESSVMLMTDPEGNVKFSNDFSPKKNTQHVVKQGLAGLTPADIALQKHKWKQNSDKTHKIEVLQNKLRYIQKMIQMNQTRDPGFKTLFIQELIPLLQKQNKQMEKLEKEIEEKEQVMAAHQIVMPSLLVSNQNKSDQVGLKPLLPSKNGELQPVGGGDVPAETGHHIRKKTFTFEVPKREDSDLMIDSTNKKAATADNSPPDLHESSTDQINRLFKEYKQQKEAYRKAVRISMLSNNNLTVSKKLETKIWNNFKAIKTSQKDEPTLGNLQVNIKVAATERVDMRTIDNGLVLKRFSQLADGDRTEIENSFKQMVKGRSTDALRKNNLLDQTQRFIKDIKKQEAKEITKTFVNQSNSLVNLQKQSHKEQSFLDTIRAIKKKPPIFKLKQSPKRISPKKLLGYSNSKSPHHKNTKVDQQKQDLLKIDNQKAEHHSAQKTTPDPNQTTQGHGQGGSPQKQRLSKLKDSSSYIRRDSNVQKLAVRAKKFDQSPRLFHHNVSVPVLMPVDVKNSNQSPQVEEDLSSSVKQALKQQSSQKKGRGPLEMYQLPSKEDQFRATHQSKMNKFLGQSMQNLGASDGFKIPTLSQQSKNRRQVNFIKQRPNNDKSGVPSSARESFVLELHQQNNQDSGSNSVRAANEKTSEIIADIRDMERVRELASIQAAAQAPPIKYSVSSQLMLFQKTRNPSQEPTLINKTAVRTKLHMQMDQKMKALKQMSNKLQTDRSMVTKPTKQLAKSMTQKNVNLTTIETIMRVRKLREEDKKQMLSSTRTMPEDGLQSYFIEGEVIQTQSELKRAHSPFTYELNDMQTPSKDMIGKSRTRSTNQFNRMKKKRVLSFLPTLNMKQSPGRLPVIH